MCEHSHDIAPLVVIDADERTKRFVPNRVRSVFACSVDGNPHRQAVYDDPDRDYRSEFHLAVAVLQVFQLYEVAHQV